MHLHFNFGFITLPAYGCMIALGLVLANIIGIFVVRRERLDINNFIILEAYCLLCGAVLSKILYLIISFREIEWSRIFEFSYFNQLMQGGFVFYGGLIGGLGGLFLAGKIHKIDAWLYLRKLIFLMPFAHSFGRIGCFCAGCCYGVPYEGIGAVVFPEGSLAIPGVMLFPVQLVEAILLMIIALTILFLQLKKKWKYTLETYLISYAVVRFVLEYFRYDAARGRFLLFSTSQWISVLMILLAIGLIIREKKR